jgi:hypothetical protein
MILAIGIMSLGGAADAQTLRTDGGPAERPPASFKGKQYVDSRGCVYIRAGSGARVTWVPRVNRKRQLYCSANNKPSLNAQQLAKISGQPATKVIKPAARTVAAKPVKTQQVATTTPTAIQPVNTTPKRRKKGLFGGALFKKQPAKPVTATPTVTIQTPAKVATVTPRKAVGPRRTKKRYPSDVIRTQVPVFQGGNGYNIAASRPVNSTPVIQGGTQYNIAPTTAERPARARTSVRGFSLFSRRKNRSALRGAQDIHPADLIKSQRAAGTFEQSGLTARPKKPVVRVHDPIHNLVVYPVVIDADITARGNAQMAMVWSNTVPMKLVQRGRVQLAKSSGYTTQ